MNHEIEQKEKNVKEVHFEYSEKDLKPHYKHALEHFKDQVEIEGFRKGNAPLNKVKEKVDKQKLDSTVFQHLYSDLVQEVVDEYDLQPVMQPKVKIEKLGEDGLKGIIIVAERPDITLGDYEKAAEEAKDEQEDEESPEIETAKNLKEAERKAKQSQDDNNQPEDLSQQSQKMKQQQKKQKLLNGILQKVIEKSEIDLPEVMVNNEVNKIYNNFLSNLQQMQVSLEDYLKKTGNKKEDMMKQFRKQAENDIKLEFLMSEIAKEENIEVEDEEVNKVIQDAVDNAEDEEKKKQIDNPQNRYHVESSLLKNKVVERLLEFAGEELERPKKQPKIKK